MNRKIELLAPGGDVEAIKAAVIAGANAVTVDWIILTPATAHPTYPLMTY